MTAPGGGAGRKRRILYCEVNEDGTVGGSHQCLWDLVRLLDRSRFEPVVVFYQNNPYVARLESEGVEVWTWDRVRALERGTRGPAGASRRVLQTLGAIRHRVEAIRRGGIDLVHVNNSPIPVCEDWLPAAVLSGRPVISHCRAEVRPSDAPLRRWLSARFHRVIAISRTVEASLDRAGLPPSRISLVYDGVDADALRSRARALRSDVRRQMEVPEEGLLVVMAGHLRSWKGQHVVLEALAAMTEADRREFRVAFAGDVDRFEPSYARSLREFSSTRGLEGCARFLGPRTDVPDLMSAADVVVHASTIPEPLGLVVLEAMALGRPVVASRLGGPSEIVTPGTGLLFDPARPEELSGHLRRLAADPGLRGALGHAARERARAFTVDANVSAIQAIYEELL